MESKEHKKPQRPMGNRSAYQHRCNTCPRKSERENAEKALKEIIV